MHGKISRGRRPWKEFANDLLERLTADDYKSFSTAERSEPPALEKPKRKPRPPVEEIIRVILEVDERLPEFSVRLAGAETQPAEPELPEQEKEAPISPLRRRKIEGLSPPPSREEVESFKKIMRKHDLWTQERGMRAKLCMERGLNLADHLGPQEQHSFVPTQVVAAPLANATVLETVQEVAAPSSVPEDSLRELHIRRGTDYCPPDGGPVHLKVDGCVLPKGRKKCLPALLRRMVVPHDSALFQTLVQDIGDILHGMGMKFPLTEEEKRAEAEAKTAASLRELISAVEAETSPLEELPEALEEAVASAEGDGGDVAEPVAPVAEEITEEAPAEAEAPPPPPVAEEEEDPFDAVRRRRTLSENPLIPDNFFRTSLGRRLEGNRAA